MILICNRLEIDSTHLISVALMPGSSFQRDLGKGPDSSEGNSTDVVSSIQMSGARVIAYE